MRISPAPSPCAEHALDVAEAAELEPTPAARTEETQERRFPFHDDDLSYRHVVTDTKKESNAVVICIMDTSGSMDTMKKYLARSFFFLLYQFIATHIATSRSSSSRITPRRTR